MAVQATNQQRCLSVLVLKIHVHAAAKQKLDSCCVIAFARKVKWGGQLLVDYIWLDSCALNQQHQHVGGTSGRREVKHGLSCAVIHVVFEHFVEF